MQIMKVEDNTALKVRLLEFVRNCSWEEVKEHVAGIIEAWEFSEWEGMFVAIDILKGYCKLWWRKRQVIC